MKKRNHLPFLIAAMLFLSAWMLPYAAAEDPDVIIAGRHSVSLSRAQREVDDLIASYQNAYGAAAFTAEDYAYIRDRALSSLATYCVMDNVIEDMALSEFTAEESALLMQQAEDAYQQTLAYFADDYASLYFQLIDEATAVEMAADYLERSDCSMASLYQTAMRYAGYDRLFEAVTCEVTLTDEEIQAYYLETYAIPDQARFAEDIPTYELCTAVYGKDAFFTPEGYRAVTYILLDIPSSLQTALDVCRGKMASVQAALDDDMAREETDEVLRRRAQAQAELDNLQTEWESLRAAIVPALQQTIDEIYERLAAGEPFEQLIDAYSADKSPLDTPDGCMVHAESIVYEQAFREAAVSLAHVGDISAPVLSESGVYILQYLSDIPGGPVALSDTAAIADEAVGIKKAETFQAAVDKWSEQYPPRIDAALILLPE